MNRPSGWRLFVAGLGAGVILNLGGMASATLLGLGEAFARFGVNPDAASVLLHSALRFGIGLAAAYLYAAVTSSFGVGRPSVLRVGLAMWLIGYAPSIALLNELGFLGGRQAVLSAGWGLVEVSVAVATAALICQPAYREAV